ncbi:TPA_asm: hypothetical protein GB227_22515 [Salmonella enterica subsp. enterica serovar Muenchen]|uniref:Conjugative transfer protein n=1 Tax=Salmonella muenchen TaxID=596 RepID=A0A6Y4F6A2_SALMU|nr:hypothetical protein [Salmonella enterica subsp. enterica]HAB5588739.1 hypothetical protein [Salmonella enterica subsp. enterica serovar Muenchen]
MKNTKSDFNWNKLIVFLAMALCWFLRVLTRSVKLMPAMLLVALAIAFYFVPESLLSDVINTWNSGTTDDKIILTRLFLKSAYILSFAACVLDELIVYPRYAVAEIKSVKGGSRTKGGNEL